MEAWKLLCPHLENKSYVVYVLLSFFFNIPGDSGGGGGTKTATATFM